jgi:hypothetical protein
LRGVVPAANGQASGAPRLVRHTAPRLPSTNCLPGSIPPCLGPAVAPSQAATDAASNNTKPASGQGSTATPQAAAVARAGKHVMGPAAPKPVSVVSVQPRSVTQFVPNWVTINVNASLCSSPKQVGPGRLGEKGRRRHREGGGPRLCPGRPLPHGHASTQLAAMQAAPGPLQLPVSRLAHGASANGANACCNPPAPLQRPKQRAKAGNATRPPEVRLHLRAARRDGRDAVFVGSAAGGNCSKLAFLVAPDGGVRNGSFAAKVTGPGGVAAALQGNVTVVTPLTLTMAAKSVDVPADGAAAELRVKLSEPSRSGVRARVQLSDGALQVGGWGHCAAGPGEGVRRPASG